VPKGLRPGSRREIELEELLGGRLLALVGGVAVLVGLAFFVTLVVDRGWIGEAARVALAFSGSAALLGVGLWLGERRGRTRASLAVAGTGIAGLFLALVAATALYALIPRPAALAAALAIAALATAVAVRWCSRTLAGLGILGALAAPILTGNGPSSTSTGFLLVALGASATVLVWRRWEWLRIAAFALALPQIAVWVYLDLPSSPLVVSVLVVVTAVELVAALAFEVRVPPAGLRPSTALLVALNGMVVAAIGGVAIAWNSGPEAAGIWIAGLAAAHAALGGAVIRSPRTPNEIGQLLLAVALMAGDAAFALLASGLVLALGWAASAVALAAAARRLGADTALVRVALGGQLALAAVHTLVVDAPATMLIEGGAHASAAAAVLAVTAGAFACARLTRSETPQTKRALDALSLAAVLYVTALCLDGTALVLASAAEAAGLAELGRRLGDRTARFGGLVFLGFAAAHVAVFEAPPEAMAYGVESVGASALAVVAVAAAAIRFGRAWWGAPAWVRPALFGGGALSVLYLASLAIVDVFQPGAGMAELGLAVGVRQQGQAALSAFWALTGFGVLAVGLRLWRRELRLGGFALLTLATGKVFLYDLAALSSTWRVLSFVALGFMLLAAALAYQRGGVRTARSASRNPGLI
jgi:uncharacterized membrane protein